MNKDHVFSVTGNIVDVVNKEIFTGIVYIEDGRIAKIVHSPQTTDQITKSPNHQITKSFILPGLIDAHIHIESSMVIPSEFARAAVRHGTVATVSDPHEIANVLGIEGVKFMINNGKKVNFKFYFGAPSCVPATSFETSGAAFGIKETEELLSMKDIKYLSEMMNFPGVLNHYSEVIGKIELAKKYNKPVDGHAPGLIGKEAKTYAEAGISTDHECMSINEAEDKISYGMKILIREGSAAKDFDELIPLIAKYPDKIMLCSDDKHPDDLIHGHINLLVKRAIKWSRSEDASANRLIDILRSCTYNPVKHYNLDVGLLQTGDPADFIIVDNPDEFNILSTYINGEKVAENGKSLIEGVNEKPLNNFHCNKIFIKDIEIHTPNSELRTSNSLKVIEAIDGQLLTKSIIAKPKIINNKIVSDIDNDILKIVVVNRYNIQHSARAVGFIKGFGLKYGAIASSVAHDSHNIIAVGVDDEDIVNAINLIIENKGGISVSEVGSQKSEVRVLPLPIAGIMSNDDIHNVADIYQLINESVKKLGTKLSSPYMTLSFMALLVIPELKIGDKGLFDVKKFKLTNLF